MSTGETVTLSAVREAFARWERTIDRANRTDFERYLDNDPATADEDEAAYRALNEEIESAFGTSGAGLILVAAGMSYTYIRRDGEIVRVVDES